MNDIIPLCEDNFTYLLVAFSGIPIHIWAEIFRWKHRFELQPIMKELTWYIKKDRTRGLHSFYGNASFVGGVKHISHYANFGHDIHREVLGSYPDTWQIDRRYGKTRTRGIEVRVDISHTTGIEWLWVSRFHDRVFRHGAKEALRQHIIENLGLKAPKSWPVSKLEAQCLKV